MNDGGLAIQAIDLREMTKIIADLTKAGFTPEEITVFLDRHNNFYFNSFAFIKANISRCKL